MNYSVVIVAAGSANRSKLGYNKNLFVLSDGERVIDKTIKPFIDDIDCKEIIIVLKEDELDEIKCLDKIKTVKGGSARKDSVLNGLKEVKEEYVLIHDGARPYLRKESLFNLKEALKENDAVILAHKAIETVKYVENGYIVKTIDRNNIYLAETPQAFKTSLILKAYEVLPDKEYTDEAMMIEALGEKVKIVENEYDNPKLTKPEDFK